MKLLNIKGKNFCVLGEVELNLDDRGLLLIQGDNRTDPSAKSNGSGKSSIADLIEWVIYGTTARDGYVGDDVVNNRVKKDCEGILDLEGDGAIYRIARYRKHSKHKNALMLLKLDDATGGITDLTCGTIAETQKKIEQIIGMPREVFNAGVYLGQERMPDLPAMTDKNLKLLIEEAAGVTKLQKAHEIARERHREASDRLAGARMEYDRAVKDIEGFKETIYETSVERDAWGETHEALVRDKTQELKTAVATFEELKARIARLDGVEVINKIKAIDAEIAKSDNDREALEAARRNQARAETALESLKTSARHLASDLKELRAECDAVAHKLGKPCPSCAQPLTEESLASAKQSAEEKLNIKRKATATLKQQLEDAQKALQNAQELVSKLERDQIDISELLSVKNDLERKIREVNSLSGQLRTQAATVKRIKADLEQIRHETNPHVEGLKRWQERLDRRLEELKRIAETIDDATKQEKLARSALDVFGTAGVRAHILDTATPFLNARTAHYLGHLSDGQIQAQWSTLSMTKKEELREKFKIEVKKTLGADRFAGLSGGEKRKVRLACAMALQDLVAARAEKPLSLFIADEIDHALDDAGLERLMAILDEKSRERGTVLVISHQSLNDWIRQSITVVNEGGIAHVV
jgi:DNA repair exonuclease SbcCD ATPase subunit